jgi:hypothetical protein
MAVILIVIQLNHCQIHLILFFMKRFFLILIAVMLFGLSSKAISKVAFIYNTDLVDVNSFKTLLEGSNFSVTVIPIANTVSTDYSSYDVIITSASSVLTKIQMDTLNAKNKPIIAMGSGGYRSLGQLLLAIGSPNGMSGNENTMYVDNASLTVYNSPIKININTGDSIKLFSVAKSTSPARMIYVPTPTASIEGLLQYKALYYSVLRQNGKYTFWGFTLSPASMTQAGKDLFLNVVENGITTYKLITGVSTSKVTEPSLSVDRQNGLLTIKGVFSDASFSVVDLSGKTVVKAQPQAQINLSGLSKGVYVIKINSSKGVVAKKFIY